MTGLYVHIPFCKRKCAYCDFCSVAYNTETAEKYIDTVLKEYNSVSEDTKYDTAYLGGGTPSLLDKRLLFKLTEGLYKNKNFNPSEFTVEVNPETENDFNFYKELGINRISIGVQSLSQNLLNVMGRGHTADGALAALKKANAVMENVSADLIIGVPSETLKDVENGILKVIPYVKHISVYILKLSDGVPMAKKIADGGLQAFDDDALADIYEAAYGILKDNGFNRYEISNFARSEKYESRHNTKYWRRENYVGLGAAAHSFINGERSENPSDVVKYMRGEKPSVIKITENEALFEEIMLGLRLEKGINLKEINEKYQISFSDKFSEELKKLKGVLDADGDNLFMRPEKMLLESAVAKIFLEKF